MLVTLSVRKIASCVIPARLSHLLGRTSGPKGSWSKRGTPTYLRSAVPIVFDLTFLHAAAAGARRARILDVDGRECRAAPADRKAEQEQTCDCEPAAADALGRSARTSAFVRRPSTSRCGRASFLRAITARLRTVSSAVVSRAPVVFASPGAHGGEVLSKARRELRRLPVQHPEVHCRRRPRSWRRRPPRGRARRRLQPPRGLLETGRGEAKLEGTVPGSPVARLRGGGRFITREH